MKNEYKLVALIAVILMGLTAMSAAVADPSDAQNDEPIVIGDPKVTKEFKTNSEGTIEININCIEPCSVKVEAKEGNDVKKSTDYREYDSGDSDTFRMSFKLSAGDHTLTIIVTYKVDDQPATQISKSITVSCEKTLWSGPLPYVALIIVAIIIVLMGFMWMRGRPKAQPAVTFNDLEEGKVAEQPAPAAATMQKYNSETSKEEGPVKYKSFRRK